MRLHNDTGRCEEPDQGAVRHGCAHPLLSVKDVTVVRDGRLILDNVSFDVCQGDFVTITGPNGGGKTTLLRVMLGLMHATRGSVVHGGGAVRTGYLPQKNTVDSQFPLTVAEVVQSGLLGMHLSKGQSRRMCARAIEDVQLGQLAGRPIGRLSGGQLQRALIARAIVAMPALLVLDEPLSYLDKNFEQHLYDLLQRLSAKMTIVLVSHEITTLAKMSTQHLLVDRTLQVCHARHHDMRLDCACDV